MNQKLSLRDLDKEVNGEIPKKNKKKKKIKKPYISPWEVCPFCQAALPLDTNSKEYKRFISQKFTSAYWLVPRIQECRTCGAYEVKICPACKHPTWHSPKDHVYRHKWMGCGFKGKAKEI
jgi:uncharacterized protein YbaR (Trm112 family)